MFLKMTGGCVFFLKTPSPMQTFSSFTLLHPFFHYISDDTRVPNTKVS